jgi:cytochrome oxidase assembly protein ShyY1
LFAFFWQLTKGLDVKKKSEIAKQIITNQNLLSEKNIENQKVELVGRVNSEYYFFLDNRLNKNSILGYEVVSLFELSGTNEQVLINIGWTKKDWSRIPIFEYENKNEITITGIAKKPSNIGYLKLGNEKFSNKAIVQNIDFAKITEEFNLNLNDIIIYVNKQAIKGYLPNINQKKNKHYTNFSYAGQWFLFFVVYLFMLTRIYRNEKNK